MRVAVTGSENHFGRAVVQALEADPEVEALLALGTRPPAQKLAKAQWREVDLVHPRSAEHLAQFLAEAAVDTVVHTAFLSRPSHRGGWAHELEAIGTRSVLAAAESTGVRKLVLRSTTLVYGARPGNPNYLCESAPLAGGEQSPWLADKVEVEHQVAQFAHKHPTRTVTVLRLAPVLGPTADTLGTIYLKRRLAPMWLGYDPLVQVVHEEDAVEAARLAVHRDVRGAVNIAAPGVVPLATAVRLAGGRPLPLPGRVLHTVSETLWNAQLGDFPPGMVDFLRFVCAGSLRLQQEQLGLAPKYGAREAILSFAGSAKLKRMAA